MRKYIYLIIFLYPALLFASQAEELMNEANQLYQDGDFAGAIEKYETVVKNNYESDALFYNLGNAYFKSGILGRAILNYERALELAPNDEDIAYNLKIVRARTVDKIQEVPQIFLVRWWDSLVASLTISGWAAVVVVIFILFLVAAGSWFILKNYLARQWSLVFVSVFLGLFIFTSVCLYSKISKEGGSSFGVLLAETVSAKVSPDEKSDDVFVIHEGVKFRVEDQLYNWAKIKLADGKVGWLPKDYYEEI